MKTNQTPSTRTARAPARILLALLAWTGTALDCFALPKILTQPTDQTNLAGTTATFSVGAAGAPPVTYQWRSYANSVNFSNILDATNDTLVLPEVQPPPPYRFAVVVCDPSGCVTSDLVRLTILSPPRITNEPTDQVVCLNDSYTNLPGVSGTMPLRHQWYFNGEPLAGKTTRILVITNIQYTNAGDYLVIVTNLYGADTSRTARLTVDCCPPSITSQPVDQHLGEGFDYTNSVTVTGSRPFSYQWYFNEETLAGKTNSFLTIPTVQKNNDGNYTAIITNLCGAVTSRVAKLEVVVPGVEFEPITNGPVVNDPGRHGGCSWVDYDHDGYLDLFACYGTSTMPGTFDVNRLFRNNRNGTFTRMTSNEVGSIVSDTGSWLIASWGDYNNDGWPDVYVGAMLTTNALYQNNGDGTFTRSMATEPMLTGIGYGAAAQWADYDADSFLDVLVARSAGHTSARFHNDGNSIFTPLAWAGPPSYVEDSTWNDYDNDGDPDWIVADYAAAGGRGLGVYRNDGHGSLTRVAPSLFPGASTTALGVTCGDYDNDGLMDACVAQNQNPGALFRNLGGGQFTNVPLPRLGGGSTGLWGDFDNDGDLDLFFAVGSIGLNQYFQNEGNGTLVELKTIALTNGSTWMAASGDYDNDGFLDLAACPVYARWDNLLLYHNKTNSNHWLLLKLVGTVANRAAIGAKVRVKATIVGRSYWQMREIFVSAKAGDDLRAHFGLGDAATAETLRVEWPSGQVTELCNVAANQILTITESPRLEVLGKSGDRLDLQLTAHPGMQWEIAASTHLHDICEPVCTCPGGYWQPVCLVTNTTSTIPVTDTNCAGWPIRFYRAWPRP